ncbi:DUF6368 family protein [Streptomyces mirabilis]|uniref:DUF6368 family protein n=1 Tax=Streptomyces mirabilis TaxID=68239 RepID=UPI00224CD56B|nr:DUF6368 family protein [Streptomyces mirabilis]
MSTPKGQPHNGPGLEVGQVTWRDAEASWSQPLETDRALGTAEFLRAWVGHPAFRLVK